MLHQGENDDGPREEAEDEELKEGEFPFFLFEVLEFAEMRVRIHRGPFLDNLRAFHYYIGIIGGNLKTLYF